ncbi:MAG: autotransporter domain-containing protein [Tabrizicola sp.]|jgi:hypothetical protein|nr:autotransporter domain-containing protein [Tabrizicola sp.]
MKTAYLAAAAACLSLPAHAQGGPSGGGAPSGGPPQEVVAQGNLARAGILPLFYSDREFGLLQTRTGESRSRIGNAGGPGGPATDYAHDGSAILAPFYFRFGRDGTPSYWLFRLTLGQKIEEPNRTQADSDSLAFGIGYQNFFSPTSVWGVQLNYGSTISEGAATRTEREALTLRLDYATVLNDNWGLAARASYSVGDTSVRLKGPGISYTQDEDQLYLQAELAGNFTTEDIAAVPEGWAFRPVLGINAQHYDLDDTLNSVGALEEGGTDMVGSVWAKASLAKLAAPGNWSTSFTLGLEHVYKDDYDDFIDEDTYAILGVSTSVLIPGGGNTISFGYDHREGLNGKRSNGQLTVSANFAF